MHRLLILEFRKLKGTFLYGLIPIAFFAPLVLVFIQYASGQRASFTEIVMKNSVFIQMTSFACVVISGCFIITREYKTEMAQYLAITPNSMVRILFCKFILLFLETLMLQLAIFGVLFCANTALKGFDGNNGFRYITAAILSALFLGCLIPAITFIALWRKSFAGASIIFLVLLMLTYPFTFMSYGFVFPQLVPIILISEYLGSKNYSQISYVYGILILVVVLAVFLYLSIQLVRKKG